MEEYRGYTIKPCNSLIGYEVEYIGRGSLHLSLRGVFTSKAIARKFIDVYVDYKGKEELDGENVQRSRSKQVQRRVNHRRKSVNNS